MNEVTEILSEENRTKKLKEILAEGKAEPGYGLKIKVKGEIKPYIAYKIPFDCLVYNPYNGRIASRVKTYEKEFRKLNPEEKEDIEKIEEFLWKSDESKNQVSMNDLITFGQKIAGVVTIDGTIADGNRRASILRKILRDTQNNPQKYQNRDLSNCKYFIAAIVDEKLTEKEMLELEQNIQFSEDKVGYDAIAKYLRCDTLKEAGFTNEEICSLMKYNSEKEIEKDLGIKKLMDEFLDYIGCPDIYTRLHETEDPFIGLYDTIQKVKNGKLSKDYTWSPDEFLDINDLKIQAFNFIRAKIGEEKQYRYITGAKKDSFFRNETAWKNYLDIVKEPIEKANEEEKTLEELRKENPNSSMDLLIAERDTEWSNKIKSKLKEAMTTSKSIIEAQEEKNEPVILLKKVKNIIDTINVKSDAFSTEEVAGLLTEIEKKIVNMKNVNEKGIKND